MAFSDKTVNCVSCEKDFIFTAGEQEFYDSKNFDSPPKRCPDCRKKAKQRKHNKKSPYDGEYRSPAFGDSNFRTPQYGKKGAAAKNRSNNNRNQPRHNKQEQNFAGEYRSPAFREYEEMDNAEDYRSPAFKEYDKINPQEEYRSPAFKEFDGIVPHDEYRSPAFADQHKKFKDQRPLFEIVCVACGETAMVPFLAEEKDDPMCKPCYKEHREMLKAEATADEDSGAEKNIETNNDNTEETKPE